MREACQRAVENALGRKLRPQEARDIETRIARHMRNLARHDASKWSATPEADRYAEAGKEAAAEIVTEAERRKTNLETRLIKMSAIEDFVDTQVAGGTDAFRLDALSRVLAPRADARGTLEGGALDQRANGIYADGVRSMMDLFEAGKRRGIWRFIPFNEPGTNRMIRRALAGLTDNVPPEFVKMAKMAHDYIELLRQRYNSAGGAIGRLEDWGEPHRWSDVRVIKAIKAEGREAVARQFAEAANRSSYVHPDGRAMTMDEITAFMDRALTTILTDGANKRLDGEQPDFATSVAANRHRAHREIHIRPDAIEGLLNKYSELGAMESLLLHMRTLARDVALVETFGPNAELTARQMIEKAADQDRLAFQNDKNALKTINRKQAFATYLYDHLSGGNPGVRSGLGDFLTAMRALTAFKALGFTVWSSLTDPVIMQHVAAARGLDAGRLWINDVQLFTGSGRRWAKRAGLITDTVAGYADRVNVDHLNAVDMGARAASFTIKATGLNWVTEARRAAYGTTLMDAIGHLVKYSETLAAVKAEDDRAFLRLLNVSEQTWSVWRLAKLDSMGANHTLLSPQAIDAIPDADLARLVPGKDPALVRNDAITQLLGIVKDETNTAVTTAGSRERATLTLGTKAGTVAGEITRALVLFKSFPWTFLTRQWEVAGSLHGQANQWGYRAALFVSLSLTGMLINWIYDLLNLKDPRAIDFSPEGSRNIIQGMLRGGALGFYGEWLFPDPDPAAQNRDMLGGAISPVTQPIEGALDMTFGNANQALHGQETNAGPEAIRYAQRNLTPNWWYSKALLDRYIFQALQEEAQPGYWRRRERNEKRTRGTTYWWSPAEPAPDRFPDFSRAIEGDMPEKAN